MYTGYFDGGSKNNPQLGAIGAYLQDSRGKIVWKTSKLIGCKTSIEAEYEALIALLHEIRYRGLKQVQVFGDSQIVINQVLNVHKVYHLSSYRLCAEAQKILVDRKITLTWIPDKDNIYAHNLCQSAFRSNAKGFTLSQLTPTIYLAIEKEQYAVDLFHNSCTCSDFAENRTCQHLESARNLTRKKIVA